MKVDQAPQPIFQLEPQYPHFLRNDQLEGYARVSLLINPEGEVEQAHCEEATHGAFAKNAIDAAKQSRWLPARKRGEPVYCMLRQTIRFSPLEMANA